MEESYDEVISKVLNETFYQSVQDLSASKVSNELSVDSVPCDMHKGCKVGISSVGELSRREDNFVTNSFPDGVNLMNKLRSMVKHFEVNPTNRKKL